MNKQKTQTKTTRHMYKKKIHFEDTEHVSEPESEKAGILDYQSRIF
jgi:hypothetical protein